MASGSREWLTDERPGKGAIKRLLGRTARLLGRTNETNLNQSRYIENRFVGTLAIDGRQQTVLTEFIDRDREISSSDLLPLEGESAVIVELPMNDFPDSNYHYRLIEPAPEQRDDPVSKDFGPTTPIDETPVQVFDVILLPGGQAEVGVTSFANWSEPDSRSMRLGRGSMVYRAWPASQLDDVYPADQVGSAAHKPLFTGDIQRLKRVMEAVSR